MAVFCCVNQNYDRLLVQGRSIAIVKTWLDQHVENFVATEISRAPAEVIMYAKKYGEAIIRVRA